MKKVISLIVIGVVSVFILVGCGSKEPYIGEFEYSETVLVDANDFFTEEIVKLAWDHAFKDTTFEIKGNGKIYLNEGTNSGECDYSVSETNLNDGTKAYVIKFADDENLVFIYDSKLDILALNVGGDAADTFCCFTRVK